MSGLMGAGGGLDKGKFLGFRIISRPISGNNNISFFKDPEYFSNDKFNKPCKVRIIAFAGVSNDKQNVNVYLSGVGELVNAYEYADRYLKYVNNSYSVSSGQRLTVNNSGNYAGVSGYIVYLDE